MGLLVDGVWHDRWYDTKETGGRFVRKDAAFRNWVTPDAAAGPSGATRNPASFACASACFSVVSAAVL